PPVPPPPAQAPAVRSAEEENAPPPPGRPGAVPLNHLPTMVVGQDTPAPAPAPHQPVYGYPPQPQPQSMHQPQPPAYGYPQGSWGHTPPYGPGTSPQFTAQQEQPRRGGRASAALIAVAVIVALGAGGSVYALMKDDPTTPASAASTPTPTPPTTAPTTPGATTPGASTPPASPTPTPPASGGIPAKFLGNWAGAIDNASGHHPRSIVIQQGEEGDTVLSMTADGTQNNGDPYHCVFQGALTSATDSTLHIGGTDPVVAEPPDACRPGEPSTITVLPSGQLRRVMVDATGKKQTLTYDKSD
ncbi:serine/threonine protein kinase, partial [Streptomyces sp. SID14478]|nr:serine/threonine protein kinase [Streptomyces sp. SID14478]